MRPRRFFLFTASAHFAASVVATVMALGAAYGAHRGWPDGPLDAIALHAATVLLAPLEWLRARLPEPWAPGYGFATLLANSLVWAGVLTLMRQAWRQARRRRGTAAAV